jgi:type VI secretion system secreted protein Hcp
MAVDAFIWFEEAGAGGKLPLGETLDKTYSDNKAFEIKDFSFSIENPSTIGSATSGAGAGKAKFNEFEITKTTDKASPIFFTNCVAGIHYGKVSLAMRKAGGDPASAGKEFLKYIFGTVFTTGIDWSGPGDEGPEEKIKFVYGTLQVEYTPQNADGTPGTAIPAGWSQVTNTQFPQ